MKISTERLCIRNAETTDALGVYELMSDEQTALQTGFSPMSHPSEAEGKIRKELVTGNQLFPNFPFCFARMAHRGETGLESGLFVTHQFIDA